MSEYKVQSVVFNKDQISLDDAFDWLVDNGYRIKKSDETETQYRFRQLEPSYLKRKGFTEYRIKQLNDVVSLVLVYPKP
jgi:hypothetical protein